MLAVRLYIVYAYASNSQIHIPQIHVSVMKQNDQVRISCEQFAVYFILVYN